MSYNSNSPRFKNWILHLIFSVIVLLSVTSIDTNDGEINSSKKKQSMGYGSVYYYSNCWRFGSITAPF